MIKLNQVEWIYNNLLMGNLAKLETIRICRICHRAAKESLIIAIQQGKKLFSLKDYK